MKITNTVNTNPFLVSIDREPNMSAPSPEQMPFGKYKGALLDDVPASYLLWLWDKDDGLWCDETVRNKPLCDYIIRSFKTLQTECKDRLIVHGPTASKPRYTPLEVYVEPTLTDSDINNDNDDIPF